MNDKELSSVIEQLPKALFWDKVELYQWEGFWMDGGIIKGSIMFKPKFKPGSNDVLLASSIKTGSTWLMAICACIMQGDKREEDFLVKDNPHFHVPTVEAMDYYIKNFDQDLYTMSSPRLFHTHLPYKVLPDSIKNSDHCKVIYIARNPKDTLIFMWHFFNKCIGPFSLEEAVKSFCSGVHHYGPFLEHVLEYWEESKKNPQKILFLKVDPKKEVGKIEMFLGKPFDNEEDLEKIVWRCSLERLQNLEVNKSGSLFAHCSNSSFFRKEVVVGDWKDYMTPEMEEQLNKITSLKLLGSDLEF